MAVPPTYASLAGPEEAVMKPVSPERWRESQRLEAEFWQKWTQLEPYRDLDLPAYWSQELARFGCTHAFFTGRRVADVGCGPHGLIEHISARQRIRVDPLMLQYLPLRRPPEPRLSYVPTGEALAAMGEALPLASASVDVIICFNALDHMCNPQAALAEFRRVLRPGGSLLLMVHTFPAWTKPGFWIDRLHPHHWTANGFIRQVAASFTVDRHETAQRRFSIPPAKWLHPSSWKYHLANLLVKSTYVRASSREPDAF
jgi:ubiquinone/menaquinone biosynthesis C-methylase UbiE